MSETPICDFVKEYVKRDAVRLHMPGHKGKADFFCAEYDITETDGADSLFEASGIIAKSEKNASEIFGCHTFYSAEGSSLCIRAMLYLALSKSKSKKVVAARNVHKSFVSAAALLGIDVKWLYGNGETYLSAAVKKEDVGRTL